MIEQSRKDVDLLIEGGIVVTIDAGRRIYAPGYVAIREGQIVDVDSGTAPSYYSAQERIDASDMVVLPGIVNAHNHLDQPMYRGCCDEPNLRDWFFPLAGGLTRERARAAASLALLEQVHYGVATTQENHWTHYHLESTDGVCEAIQQSGMRAVVSRGMNDKAEYRPPAFLERVEDVIDDLNRLEQEYDSDHIRITSEPSTILRCKPETIVALREWALQRGKMWHIHLAQNREELAEALRTVGMGSVQYAESLGVLGPEMLAIHCAGLLDEEVELLGRYQVRVVHCPLAVMHGGGRVPPIWELEKHGAVIAVGTDGILGTKGQNPWESMKMAVYMQRVRFNTRDLGSAEQALEMMTIKAARALDMDDRVGSLEVGKEADIAMFRRDQLHIVPDAMLVDNMIYSSTTTLADTVLVGGRVVLHGGHSTVFDTQEVVARAREAQVGMIKEAGLEGKLGLAYSWPVVTA
jgi:5-methylthioadenosine/S-adenosylhomocysteine deaminase